MGPNIFLFSLGQKALGNASSGIKIAISNCGVQCHFSLLFVQNQHSYSNHNHPFKCQILKNNVKAKHGHQNNSGRKIITAEPLPCLQPSLCDLQQGIYIKHSEMLFVKAEVSMRLLTATRHP